MALDIAGAADGRGRLRKYLIERVCATWAIDQDFGFCPPVLCEEVYLRANDRISIILILSNSLAIGFASRWSSSSV